MAILTILYVGTGFVDDQGIAPLNLPTYWYAPFIALFLAEFMARFVDAENRIAYLQNHWIDLITSVPVVGGVRLFRLLRLFRLVKVGDLARKVMLRGHRRDTWFVWPTVILFWICSAYALWLFEQGVNPRVSSFGDALYLSFMTASTVGYGDVSPMTTEGKVVAGLIVFFALGLLGFASSRLTAWWLGSQEDAEQFALVQKLSALEAQLERTERLLIQISGQLQSAPNSPVGLQTQAAP